MDSYFSFSLTSTSEGSDLHTNHVFNTKTSRGCKHDGCTIARPNFNFPGESIALFCKSHAKNGMVDVRSKLCNKIDCNRRATFGNLSDNVKIVCSKHKSKGMIDLNNRKKDTEIDAVIINKANEPHQLDMIDDIHVFNGKSYKITSIEKKIRVIFDMNGLVYIQNDIRIGYTENHDMGSEYLFDCVTHRIVVEVSAISHNGDEKVQEILRMEEIRPRNEGKPAWFIKFNPYEYKKMNGRKRVPGESQSKRHLKLLEWIKFCKETSPTQYGDFYRAIYLYHDNWDGIGEQHRIKQLCQ
jgi:hypothetical protein